MQKFTHPIVLFDGVCNLCNGVVDFLIDHDPEARLRFGTLQHFVGAKDFSPLRGMNVDPDDAETIVLIEPARDPHSPPRVTVQSDAALRITGYLARPWHWARLLRVIPRPIRDAAYDVIARNRYRWFGKRDTCRVPTPDIVERFIDW